MQAIVMFVIVTFSVNFAKTQDALEGKVLYLEKTVNDGDAATNINQYGFELNKLPENVELNNNERNGRFSYLHAIEKDLLHQNWEENEQPCLRQLLKVIRNVQNSTLWATWIWDSMQFPVGQLYGSRNHLGNYDQCMNLPWKDHPEFRTQYCLAELSLSDLDPTITNVDLLGSVQEYIRFKTKHNLRYNVLTWGICAPVICKPKSISKFTDVMFGKTHLGLMDTQFNISLNSAYCQVAGEFEEIESMEYILLSFFIILIITTLLCSTYVTLENVESKSCSIRHFAEAFSIQTNVQWLMKMEDHSIKSLLGIRVVLTFLVVAGHLWFGINSFGIHNAGEIDKELDDSMQCIRFNVDMTVDIFFMMSGLLFAKSIMGKEVNIFNPFTLIAKRYIRLICSVLITILVLPTVLLRGDPAPLVKRNLQLEVDTCAKNWWKSIFMIGNYGDIENMCYPILWSLSCDFHLFVIGILIYCIYCKNRRAGIKAYVICAVISVIAPIIYGYTYNVAAVVSFDFKVADNYRKNAIGDPAYVNTHLRAGPYFVGLAFGYLMVIFRPEKYRNVISKKSSIFAFFMFLLMFASLNILCGVYHGREYGALEGAVFSVMRRNFFALLVGFLITICEYGTLPLISDALSWSGLVPLAKLTFGVYLTHFMFVFRFVSRSRVPLRSNVIDLIITTFGLMAITMILSLFIWIFWEAPMLNLSNMIFKRFTSKVQINGKVENGMETNGKLNIISADLTKHSDRQQEKKFD